MNNIKTLRELVIRAANKYGDRDAFRIREKEGYRSISFNTLADDVLSLASAFVKRGYTDKHIGVIGENSYEWVVTYLAAVSCRAVIVPIDKELTPNEVSMVIEQSNASVVIYSSDYDEAVSNAVLTMSGINFFVMGSASKSNPHTRFYDLLSEGDDKQAVFDIELDSNAVCGIVFTSGTTGFSKGVMLSHANLISNIYSCSHIVTFGESRFSVLPMHHTYEFTLGVCFSIFLGTASSLNNSIKYVAQNLQIFAPDDLVIVPLIAESLYNSIWQNIRKSGKENVVKAMIKVSNALLCVGIDIRKVLFKKVHSALGGRVNHIFCGGAAIDPEVAKGFLDFGFKFYIGYGITECSPIITSNLTLKPNKMHTCGTAVDCCEILIDQPNENGEGEILIKGINVMLGYYKNPKATAEVIVDGWYHSGDIGRLDKDGDLIITGRIKNIIVLKNGKNVYPEELESYLDKIDAIKEVVVSAGENSSEDISIKAEVFANTDWAEQNNISDIEDYIRREILKLNNTLAYYKRISEVVFRDTEFEKTTTKKIKRHKNHGENAAI